MAIGPARYGTRREATVSPCHVATFSRRLEVIRGPDLRNSPGPDPRGKCDLAAAVATGRTNVGLPVGDIRRRPPLEMVDVGDAVAAQIRAADRQRLANGHVGKTVTRPA